MFFGICLIVIAIFAGFYCYLYYPRQIMPVGRRIKIDTPSPERYHNDCLHPCVRLLLSSDEEKKYVLVQSPLYDSNEAIENPILYYSDSLDRWTNGTVVRETPEIGYNSDPNIYIEGGRTYVFWREVGTPSCFEANTNIATFGCYTDDGVIFSKPLLYLRNTFTDREKDGFPAGDSGQCPILMKHGQEYLFYCVCEDYSDYTCKGLALWKGHSLSEPDFVLDKVIPFNTKVTVGKWLQKRIFGMLFFVPKPVRQMLWHFDMFEYQGVLFLVFGVGKGKGNILISRSEDWRTFRTSRIPLVNNNCSENHLGFRQYYYKSTALVDNDTLTLFYTSQNPQDSRKNDLYFSQVSMEKIRRLF